MSASSDSDYSFAGAVAATRREMLRLTPGQRINRAAELWEAGQQLAAATEAARRRATSNRPTDREPAKKQDAARGCGSKLW